MNYQEFLRSKMVEARPSGFECGSLNPHLKDFQAAIVRWALKGGRRAIGAELKPSYYRQAIKNLASAKIDHEETEDDRQMTIEEAYAL